MINVLRSKYRSLSDDFILPLTGIQKTDKFDVKSYLFWEDYSIEDYKLVVKVEYGHRYDEFKQYLREVIFKSKESLVIQSFDFEGFSILIYDISNWSEDIELFLQGKYSKMSPIAKTVIEEYHTFYENGKPQMVMSIYASLFPTKVPVPKSILDGMTPIDYVIKHYIMVGAPDRIDLETVKILKERGELCSVYDKEAETLILESQNSTPVSVE